MQSHNDQATIATMERVSGWLLKKLNATITEEEEEALAAWLHQRTTVEQQFFEEAISKEQIEAALRYMYQVDEVAALRDVMSRVEASLEQTVPVLPAPKRSRSLLYRWAAAAIFTGILATAVVLISRKKAGPDAAGPALVTMPDIQPGGDKAVLTLSDGRKIVLDSLHNGGITREGAIAIHKEAGVVVYQPANENEEAAVKNETAVRYNLLTTPRGGQFNVVLPDGSKVWLNAASSIRYPTAFTGNTRTVTITGEAYFEVQKDATHPFRVTISATDNRRESMVEVLGTHFNINTYEDEATINTTLLEGKVKVTANTAVILHPGDRSCLTNEGDLTIEKGTDTEEAIAWKNGLFQFQDAPIAAIMRQIARWYNVAIVYRGKVDNQFVGKIPRHVSLKAALKILEDTGWVHFTVEGNTVIVIP